MACQAQSSFWINFDTLRKSRRRNSIWASFRSPYDPASVSEGVLLHSKLSRDTRTSRSLPPRSPRTRRCDAASPSSLRPSSPLHGRHHAPSGSASRAENEAALRDGDERREKKKKKKILRKKKHGNSKATETFDSLAHGAFDATCCRESRLLSGISKSSDELSKVKRSYLEELDLCRVGLYASRSDESLVSYGYEGHGSAGAWPDAIEKQPEMKSDAHLHRSLTTFWKMNGRGCRKAAGEHNSEASDWDERRRDLESGRERGRLAQGSAGHQQQRLSRRDAKDFVGIATRDDVDDHPALTVRPGYRLPRSRSCGARTCHRVASPPREVSGNPRWRSSACLGTARAGIQRSLSVEPENREDFGGVEDIPPIAKLRFNKYNFRRRRPDRLPLDKESFAPRDTSWHILPESADHSSFVPRPLDGDARRCDCGCLQATERRQERVSGSQKNYRSLLIKTLSCRSKSVDRVRASLAHQALDAGLCPLCQPFGSAVIGEEADGRSRGLIFDGSSSARTGSFPNSLVTRHDAHGRWNS
ncbi:uncharacterized protein LOC122248853 [Penaeus japonicus]|uniref:uncharacterized protein LOC122248853 n=1 Tax=Penaeus japonicus TaxID=27405 RepID=UPI001C71108F|nr:uncharacterized protein LOC122248853 [Penaeus japonicus]